MNSGGFIYPVQTAEVGEHHGAGKQSHVPMEVLDHLGAEPGDQLVYRLDGDGISVELEEA